MVLAVVMLSLATLLPFTVGHNPRIVDILDHKYKMKFFVPDLLITYSVDKAANVKGTFMFRCFEYPLAIGYNVICRIFS